MRAGAKADAVFGENGGGVMGVDAGDVEGDDTGVGIRIVE